jgi:hypothetical protein
MPLANVQQQEGRRFKASHGDQIDGRDVFGA